MNLWDSFGYHGHIVFGVAVSLAEDTAMAKTPSPWHPYLGIQRTYSSTRLMSCVGLFIALSVTAVFGQDDDDEQPPGLRARYLVNEIAVERVDSDISFDWGQSPPDPRLPAGPSTLR